MIHGSTTYDFNILNAQTRGRYQGVSDHTKINTTSEDFIGTFWMIQMVKTTLQENFP
jgi:hypothetical protein